MLGRTRAPAGPEARAFSAEGAAFPQPRLPGLGFQKGQPILFYYPSLQSLLALQVPGCTGKRGHPANGKVRSLLLRFDRCEEAVLRFATDFALPFDNYLAERDLRVVKLSQ